VSRLEKRGWVRRSTDPADGRYTLAHLTGDGWDKVVATAPGHVETVRRLVLDPLSRTQVRQLGEIGRRILSTVDPGNSFSGGWPSPHDDPH
jgi:DNA-binding MarR family transcriptional regulator